DPSMDALREHSGFQDILRRVGVPAQWQPRRLQTQLGISVRGTMLDGLRRYCARSRNSSFQVAPRLRMREQTVKMSNSPVIACLFVELGGFIYRAFAQFL